LKYDAVASSRSVDATLVTFLEDWNPLWIAASTMPGEDELVLDAYKQLLAGHPNLKLLLAPRHPERCDTVEAIVKARGLETVRRTELGKQNTRPAILLLDTIGELAGFFQFATVVYMGGSLVPTGGHNILEPARHSKPILFGPHMENFRDITRLFLDAKAAVQIPRAADLAPTVLRLLSSPQHAAELGRNALGVVEQNTGATERVLRVLEPAEASR
jgi:3-deoxy-D-manno-octulosonic-acid transferase